MGILPLTATEQGFSTGVLTFFNKLLRKHLVNTEIIIFQFPITCSFHGSIYNETSVIKYQINLRLDTKSAEYNILTYIYRLVFCGSS